MPCTDNVSCLFLSSTLILNSLHTFLHHACIMQKKKQTVNKPSYLSWVQQWKQSHDVEELRKFHSYCNHYSTMLNSPQNRSHTVCSVQQNSPSSEISCHVTVLVPYKMWNGVPNWAIVLEWVVSSVLWEFKKRWGSVLVTVKCCCFAWKLSW